MDVHKIDCFLGDVVRVEPIFSRITISIQDEVLAWAADGVTIRRGREVFS
ncbi:hypothetical protein [Thermus sp. 93170]